MTGTGAVRPFTIVVGVSAGGSAAALRWASAEAAQHSGVVIAVTAWRARRTPDTSAPAPTRAVDPNGPAATLPPGTGFDDAVAELQNLVIDTLGPASGVECRVVRGGRRKVLRSLSRHADLLVIDAPQRTDVRSSPLFAQRLIHAASCPVVVMPPRVAALPDTPVTAAGKRIGRSLLNAAGTAGRPGVRAPHNP